MKRRSFIGTIFAILITRLNISEVPHKEDFLDAVVTKDGIIENIPPELIRYFSQNAATIQTHREQHSGTSDTGNTGRVTPEGVSNT